MDFACALLQVTEKNSGRRMKGKERYRRKHCKKMLAMVRANIVEHIRAREKPKDDGFTVLTYWYSGNTRRMYVPACDNLAMILNSEDTAGDKTRIMTCGMFGDKQSSKFGKCEEAKRKPGFRNNKRVR